jgi:hypothetical protein
MSLVLARARRHGTIPSQICGLPGNGTRLSALSLQSNQLEGDLRGLSLCSELITLDVQVQYCSGWAVGWLAHGGTAAGGGGSRAELRA